MATKTLKGWFTFLLLAITIACGAPSVRLKNESLEEVTNIHLVLQGADVHIDRLAPGKEWAGTMRSKRTGGFQAMFDTPGQHHVIAEPQGYVEPEGYYKALVTIKPDKSIDVSYW